MAHADSVPFRDLIVRRNELFEECKPDPEFRAELAKCPIESQIVALALVVGMRKARPTRH